jgi:hypothetical protein
MKVYTKDDLLNDVRRIVNSVKAIEEKRKIFTELNDLDLNPSSYYLNHNKAITEEHRKNLMILKIRYGV